MTRPVLHPGIFVIVLMLAGAGLAQDWQHRELEQGTKPALALTLDGQPMIIYMLERAQGWVKIAQLEGDSWQITVVDSGYFYGPPDIAIGADGVPHATYHDHQDLNVDVEVLVVVVGRVWHPVGADSDVWWTSTSTSARATRCTSPWSKGSW